MVTSRLTVEKLENTIDLSYVKFQLTVTTVLFEITVQQMSAENQELMRKALEEVSFVVYLIY